MSFIRKTLADFVQRLFISFQSLRCARMCLEDAVLYVALLAHPSH
jgi:hypothetical protein